MITMHISMTVPEGTEEAWAQMRRVAHAAYPQQPGYVGARVLHDCDRPAHYVLQSDWQTRADADQAVRAVGMLWRMRALDLQPGELQVACYETIDPLA